MDIRAFFIFIFDQFGPVSQSVTSTILLLASQLINRYSAILTLIYYDTSNSNQAIVFFLFWSGVISYLFIVLFHVHTQGMDGWMFDGERKKKETLVSDVIVD